MLRFTIKPVIQWLSLGAVCHICFSFVMLYINQAVIFLFWFVLYLLFLAFHSWLLGMGLLIVQGILAIIVALCQLVFCKDLSYWRSYHIIVSLKKQRLTTTNNSWSWSNYITSSYIYLVIVCIVFVSIFVVYEKCKCYCKPIFLHECFF